MCEEKPWDHKATDYYIGDLIRMKYVKNLLPKAEKKGMKCLDAGAGLGIYRELVEEKGYNYIPVDISSTTPMEVLIEDATNLSFENNSFDVVICVDVIEEIEHDKKAIDEIYRVLKPGGICLLHTPNLEQTHVLLQPKDNPAHVRRGYLKKELKELFDRRFTSCGVFPTFNSEECIAWEVVYCKMKELPIFPEKIVNFNFKEYKNLGWLVVATK